MLIEFSVGNYRSIAEEQKLTMVASVGAKRRKHHSTKTGNAFAPTVLNSACIFGPNGAGKTSFIKAAAFLAEFVVSSAKDSTNDEAINVKSFAFDNHLRNAPTSFEVIFVTDETLYQYGFILSEKMVISEWMFSRANGNNSRMREVFTRNYNEANSQYTWSFNESILKGERELWRKSTRNNSLFLSTAVQLNSDSLKPAFSWIQRSFRVISSPDRLAVSMSAKRVLDSNTKADVVNLLNAADIHIVDIEVDEEDAVFPKEILDLFAESLVERISTNLKGAKDYKVRLVRQDREGNNVRLDFADESDGTKVLFSLAAPWLEALSNGYTVLIDELHNSLHPLALKFLVGMFHDPELNDSGAQLIFTTHETSVISKGFMHRDQIWLMEKSEDNASHLYPLSDFAVREVDTFQRSYLGGSYGALPRPREFRFGQK